MGKIAPFPHYVPSAGSLHALHLDEIADEVERLEADGYDEDEALDLASFAELQSREEL